MSINSIHFVVVKTSTINFTSVTLSDSLERFTKVLSDGSNTTVRYVNKFYFALKLLAN